MMDTTNMYLKDWHRRFAGQRFGFLEQFCLENGTTSFEALVTAAVLRPQQTVLDLAAAKAHCCDTFYSAMCGTSAWISPPRPSRRPDSNLAPPLRNSWKPMPDRCHYLTRRVMWCSRTWLCTS
jgi:hypothetical protein